MAELLVELFSEEIPARLQARAAEDLRRLVCERLTAANLAFSEARSFVTPRRLALVVTGLPEQQPDLTEERRGPRVDAPEQAIAGFLKANGLSSVSEAERRETPKGAFYFVKRVKAGLATKRALPEVLEETLDQFPWAKSMRWAESDVRWVRPLRSILAVFAGEVLDFTYDLRRGSALGEVDGGKEGIRQAAEKRDAPGSAEAFMRLTAGRETFGHRFLAPRQFAVEDFDDYQAKLRAAKVILDPAERQAEIRRQTERLAARHHLTLKPDQALLDEVTGLVEWPIVLMGEIDDAFMDLPPEVLTTSMRTHQKYLALTDADGGLASRFLVVANMETPDDGKTIVGGNERVLRARLADARFFWDQDRKVPLASRTTALEEIVFHEKLGTLDQKVDRIQALARALTAYIPEAEKDLVRSAARLAKADLVSGMVGEFPELQGVMGRYYALHDGEAPAVADAIAEHYSPLGPSDTCPSAPTSVAVALADKIDTLVGFFSIDERPTGSKDPYALRRAALGVIRLIVENRLRIPLLQAFDSAALSAPAAVREDWRRVSKDLLAFFADRLKVALRDQGVRHDLISAVFAVGGEDDLARLLARVDALARFLETDDGANLLVAYRRAANIVRIEEKKDKARYDGEADPVLFAQEEERRLLDALAFAERAADEADGKEDFTGAMAALASLRAPVDVFFDKVTVNADDPRLRANRLRLLSRIRGTLDRVADFSRIEG